MIRETIYSDADIHWGRCKSCDFEKPILDNGKCIACNEDDNFYKMTMQ